MYRDHVPTIAAYGLSSPKAFERVAMFAVLSARQPFVSVPKQLESLAKLGERSPHLFSWKLNAFRQIRRRRKALLSAVSTNDTRAALHSVCQIHGMGLVKGAFVLQMLGHDLACLDSQNIAREGRDPRAYDTRGIKQGKGFERKLDAYIADTGGKAQCYWDTWCEHVGAKYKLTPDECSAIHCAVVTEDVEPIAVPRGSLVSMPF